MSGWDLVFDFLSYPGGISVEKESGAGPRCAAGVRYSAAKLTLSTLSH